MTLWYHESFKNLLQLAEELETDARFQLLAHYCRLREKGLRQQAFHSLKDFITLACSWDIPFSRNAAVKILTLDAGYQTANRFLVQPLQNDFLFPLLTDWMHQEPGSSIPLRWLGLLNHDMNMLQKALEIASDDIAVRVTLIKYALSFFEDLMDWESIAGELKYPREEAILLERTLKRARTLLINAPDHEQFTLLAREADECAVLLSKHID